VVAVAILPAEFEWQSIWCLWFLSMQRPTCWCVICLFCCCIR